jgi:hypothetical protein
VQESTTRRIVAPLRLDSIPVVYGRNDVKNSLVECKQAENGPKQLSPFKPRRPLLVESAVSLYGCPDRTTSTTTVVPVYDHEGRAGSQRQEGSCTTLQSDIEVDFIAEIDELLQLVTADFGSLNENYGLHFGID